ncbi:MAG: serine hydrolase [Clostridia bacterium]|nr:serine hydrolase [Clostridia bacterium]
MLTDILNAYRNKAYFDSAICFVFDRDRILETGHVGPASPDALYDLASVSKIITTTLLLDQMEKGRLSPADPVLTYLPELSCGTSGRRLKEVTIEKLMTHTSGILPWYPFYADGRPFEEIFEMLMAKTPEEKGYAYSDLNYMLLARVYTAVSGKSLRDGVQAVICEQMGIPMQYGPVPAAQAAPCCLGNQIEKRMCAERGLSFDGWREDGQPVCGTCNDGNAYYYFGGVSGHAGLFASADAMMRLCRFYLTTDRKAYVTAMETTVGERGLGFDKSDLFPEGCGHTGFTGTSIYLSRQQGVGAVLLTNRLYLPQGGTPTGINPCRREVHEYALRLVSTGSA